MTNYAEKVSKASILIFVMFIITSILGYLLRLFLARSLPIDEFGLFYSIFALLVFLSTFKNFGLRSALAKYIPEFLVKKKYSSIKSIIVFTLFIQFIFGVIIFIPLFIFSDTLSIDFFGSIAAKSVLQILAFEFLIAFPVISAIFQGFQRMKTLASIELVRIISVFGFLIFFFPISLNDVAISYLLASIFVQIIFFSYTFKIFPQFIREKTTITKHFAKKILGFSVLVFLGTFASTIISYTDTLALTFFRTLEEVGFYQAALPTTQILWMFSTALIATLFPVISEIWTKGQKNILSKGITFIIKYSFIFIMPFILILIVFPEIVISFLFGAKYIPAAIPLQVLSFTALFYTMMSVGLVVLNSIGKPLFATKTVVIISTFNLIANIILIPPFGTSGAAIATLMSFIIGFFITSHFLKTLIAVKIPFVPILKSFSVGILSLIIIFLIKGILILEPIPEALISLGISFVIYFYLILFAGIVTAEDMRILRKTNIYIPLRIKKYIQRFVKG